MLKESTEQELTDLAAEIRQEIIDVCSINGGHVGASLGAVELTVALHSEFDTPVDSIVWDVGHQSYAHKLLTRPREQFKKLRKQNGPSGFTSRQESPHDVFGAGHSSTSLSAALGIAMGKQLQNDMGWTIGVIGDGGLTAGLAFEALNQAGAALVPKLLLIINDNNLSIGANVGALNQWAFGAEREPRKFFESLGFDYVGPLDGHNINLLKTELRKIKVSARTKVVVLHVLTKKGKGFPPAEREPIKFHGVGPFDKLTGKSGAKASQPTYSQVFGKRLAELADTDKRVIAITAAMSEGTGLIDFAKRHPNRFFDVGIAEPHAVVFAAGLATQGLKPVVAVYSTFLQRAVDSIVHDAALQKLDMVLAIDRAGLVGPDGPTHHGMFDIPILRAIPNVAIAAPSSAEDLSLILEQSISQPAVKAIRYPRGVAKSAPPTASLAWGKARLVQLSRMERDTLVIWALGQGVTWAAEALATLPDEINARITFVDARFAKPIDEELLAKTLSKPVALLTVEDGSRAGGFGSALIEAVVESGLPFPSRCFSAGVPDRWIPHAEIAEQRAEAGLAATQLGARIRKLLSL